ncbi:MAG: iron-sulfur cluster biosynthesis transcriptional regulator SufR [Prochlorotrichaceae cyanobacterium]|jgi:DeoR family suf operon transcriptional repressor
MTSPLQPSTKDDILRYLLRKGQSSVQDLSDDLGISPQAIRRHLKDLEAETLIVHQSVSSGMGRPQHVYQLSKTGRSYFPEAYDRFALDLLDTLAATVPPEQLQTILRQQWHRKGLDYQESLKHLPLGQRVKRLVELRRSEGYMTDWHSAAQGEGEALENPEVVEPQEDEDAFVLTEYNCTIANVVESFPSICDYELELFSTALGTDCQVERTHWMINGQHCCGYLIQKRSNKMSDAKDSPQ